MFGLNSFREKEVIIDFDEATPAHGSAVPSPSAVALCTARFLYEYSHTARFEVRKCSQSATRIRQLCCRQTPVCESIFHALVGTESSDPKAALKKPHERPQLIMTPSKKRPQQTI